MGSRRAGCDHHSVQLVFSDGLLDLFLRILGAGKQVFIGKCHKWQCFYIFGEGRDIDYASDIDAAVADEHADPRFQPEEIQFSRNLKDL